MRQTTQWPARQSQAVKEYILAECRPRESADTLRDSVPLVTGGILNLLTTVRLVAVLEETYSIQFAPDETVLENLDTLARIVSVVESTRRQRPGLQ